MKQTIITLTALAALMLGGCARYMTYSDYKLDVQSGDQTAKVTSSDERYGTVYSFSDELYDMRVQVLLQSIAVEIDNKSDQTITIPVARIRYTDSNGVESSVITSSTPIEKRLDTPAPVTVAPGQTATLDLVPLKNIRFSKFNGFEREEIFPDFKTKKALDKDKSKIIGQKDKLTVPILTGDNGQIEKQISFKVEDIQIK